METINFRGKTIDIYAEKTGWKFEYTDANNIIYLFKVNTFSPHLHEDQAKRYIEVPYTISRKFPDDKEVVMKTDIYIENDLDTFYDFTTSLPVGGFSGKAVLNGLFRRLEEFDGNAAGQGHQIFNPVTGEIVQPITFDLTLTDPTLDSEGAGQSNGSIQLDIIDGVAPFEVKKETEEAYSSIAGSTHTFSDLPAGEYVVWVRDSEGTERYKTVNLTNQPYVEE